MSPCSSRASSISRACGWPRASRGPPGGLPRVGRSGSGTTARVATSSSRSTGPSEAPRRATTRFGRERRCRPSPESRRRSSPVAWPARACPMSSRGRSTRSSRRPRGAYPVPLDARSAETVGVGDLVSLATPPQSPVRPVDGEIADGARARGDVFAVEPSTGGDAQVLMRRLRDLERAGLVAAEGPARWKVPPDLVDRLAERGRNAPPRHRLVVRKEPLSLKEQVVHRGPVWLDRLKTETLARWGLGADVRQAVAERREALRRLGIGPDDPDRVA